MVKIGLICGSGMCPTDMLTDYQKKTVTTPFGPCSDDLYTGQISGVDCVCLARHARGHIISPSLVNYRANIWALKMEECTHIIVTTAVGSLKEDIHPGDIVFVSDFIDRTYKRTQTFYDGTLDGPKGVCHIPLHTPFCLTLKDVLIQSAKNMSIRYHSSGTLVTVEGPRFSSRAESKMFRLWGADVINMTISSEVVLAKEVGISYGAVALVTDYDCWREGTDHVNVELVMKTLQECAHIAKKLIYSAIPDIAKRNWDDIITDNNNIVQSSIIA